MTDRPGECKGASRRAGCLREIGLDPSVRLPRVKLPAEAARAYREAEPCSPDCLAILQQARQSVRRHRPGEAWAELWGPKGFLCLFNVDFQD